MESKKLKKYLVACYLLCFPTRYEIRFYRSDEILGSGVARHRSPVYGQDHSIRWGPSPKVRFERSTPPPCGSLESVPVSSMTFMYSSKLDNNVLYAVDGSGTSYDRLPKDFVRIPLPNKDETIAQLLPSMRVGKANPLIVEIGASIYVLSMPPLPSTDQTQSTFAPPTTFEVYNLNDSTWTLLQPPPFSGLYGGYHSPIIQVSEIFSYFVVDDHQLFVSDGIRSWCYDTKVKSWADCCLFSDCFPNVRLPELDYLDPPNLQVGNGFPFRGQAILWKDGIYLCIIPARNPPIGAFSIHQEKAHPVELNFDECGLFERGGQLTHLVDMGDDHVVVLHYDYGDEDRGTFKTVVMFKLSTEENGSVSCQIQGECRYPGSPHDDYSQAQYCFAI